MAPLLRGLRPSIRIPRTTWCTNCSFFIIYRDRESCHLDINPQPSPAPVLIHQNEKFGHFQPLEEADVVCTLQSPPTRKNTQANRDMSKAIQQLMEGTEYLRTADRDKLHSLLQEFVDVISTGDDDLGRTDLVHHKIDTGDATPVRLPARRLPFQQRHVVHQMLDDMLSRDVIEGPWSSPVLVKGSTRFCVNFRKVNNLTKKDAHPLPIIDDTLDTLGEARWFSTLDVGIGKLKWTLMTSRRQHLPHHVAYSSFR